MLPPSGLDGSEKTAVDASRINAGTFVSGIACCKLQPMLGQDSPAGSPILENV